MKKEEENIMKQNTFIALELGTVLSIVLFAVALFNGYFMESLMGAAGTLGGIIGMIAYVIDKNAEIISKISK